MKRMSYRIVLPVFALFLVLGLGIAWAAIGDVVAWQNSAGVDVLRLTTSSLMPGTTNTVDLGTTGVRFKNGYFAGDVSVSGTLNRESESLTVSGDSSLGDGAGDTTTVTGNLYANDNVSLGSSSSDTLTVNGRINTDVLPSTDAAHDLGSAAVSWDEIFCDGLATLGSLTVPGATTLNGDVIVGSAANDAVTVNGTADMKSVRMSGYYNVSMQNTDTSYTVIAGGKHFVTVSDTSEARTVTLPTVASMGPGGVLIVKDTSGAANVNAITIDGSGDETIDGAASKDISTAYGIVRLITDGTAWFTW